MKKIPTIYLRNPDDMGVVLNQQNPACDWVFEGDGIPTRKYDGTCCMIKGGHLFKRREIKPGKPLPAEFIGIEEDPITHKIVGWMPVIENAKEDKWHMEAFSGTLLEDGTYELVGPKIQGNPEGYENHVLMSHSNAERMYISLRTYARTREWLEPEDIEGIVFHNRDGRMAKIKKRDFGLPRKPLKII